MSSFDFKNQYNLHKNYPAIGLSLLFKEYYPLKGVLG